MTIKYQELDWRLFTDSPREPISIAELKETLFPIAGFEEKFYENNSLKPILKYVQQQIGNYETEEIVESGIINQCIKLSYRIKDYPLLIEYGQLIEIENMFNYLIANINSDNSNATYNYYADIIAMYFVSLDKIDLFDKQVQKKFIDIYLNYSKRDLFSFVFDAIYETYEISIDLLMLFFKTIHEVESPLIAEKLAVRSFIFFMRESELRFFHDEGEIKALFLNELTEEIITNKSKFPENLIRFLNAVLNGENDQNRISIIIDIIKSINKKIVTLHQKDTINIINDLFEYIYGLLESDDKEISKKLTKAIFSSDFKKNWILSSIHNRTFEYLLKDLFDIKAYEDYHKIYLNSSTEKKDYINGKLTFETAFVVKKFGNKDLAKKLYTKILSDDKENTAVMNNLAVIYIYEKNYETALELLLKGKELDPEDKYINNNLNDVHKAIEELKQRPKRMKDYYFKTTDKLQKQILFTIYKLLDAPDFSLALVRDALNISDIHFFNKKLNPLLENGLIEEQNGEIIFDATIYELVKSWVDPKMERQVIKSNKNKFYRPIFYHESEINLYRVLIETFPQHLVFPNMDLKAIIDLDKVKEFLSNDEMSYLFKAHVDFAVINTTTYFPIICFEKDSDYNDSKRAEQNGIVKNHIFEISGLPLIRVRYNAAMDYERLKEEIKTTTKQFLLDTQSEYPESNLLSEFDLKRFGIYDSSIDEVELKAFWNEIVGEIIAQSTLEFSFNKEQMLLSISLNKQAEMIISIGLDSIKTKIYNKYPQLNQINFYYE